MFFCREAWDWIMALNVTSVTDGVRLFVPTMIEQKEEAHVINTASIYGLHTGHRPYGVTKQAVVALSEATQVELRESGIDYITISSLMPSWIVSNIANNGANGKYAAMNGGDSGDDSLGAV
jgi:NAD(P)-dependent dehydrogenase (short-subunit alcohol dehydrogenase family)